MTSLGTGDRNPPYYDMRPDMRVGGGPLGVARVKNWTRRLRNYRGFNSVSLKFSTTRSPIARR